MRPDALLRRLPLALALVCGVAFAAAPAWKDLSREQQAVIAPSLVTQGGSYDALPEARRAALALGAERWLSMSGAERVNATRQFTRWQQMSAAEKAAVIEQRSRYRRMTPAERKALLETQRQFEQLDVRQQQALRDEFNTLLPAADGLEGLPSTTPPGTPGTPQPGPTPGVSTLPNLPSSGALGNTLSSTR